MFEDDYLKNGARKYVKPECKTTPIIQCDMQGNFIARFNSVQEAAEKRIHAELQYQVF
jgi:hypothetical protein